MLQILGKIMVTMICTIEVSYECQNRDGKKSILGNRILTRTTVFPDMTLC